MNSDSDIHVKHLRHFLQFVGGVLLIGLMYFARDVLIPLSLGALLAFFLSPIVNRIERLGLSNIPSVIISAVVAFAILILFLIGLSLNLTNLAEDLPQYRNEIQAKMVTIKGFTSGFGARLNRVTEEFSTPEEGEAPAEEDQERQKEQPPGGTVLQPPAPERGAKGTATQRSAGADEWIPAGSKPEKPLYVVEPPRNQIDWKTWAGGAAVLFGPLGTAGLAIIVALFALIYRDDLRDRFVSMVSKANYVVTADAISEASAKIVRYLFAQVALNFSYAVIFAIGLFAIGRLISPTGQFPYIIVLSTFAGVVRFVPYLGPWLGAVVPIGFSALIFPGFTVTFTVTAMIVCMELISNNVVEPWAYGTSTGVSPMAVILAAIFWGWLWGPIGILLATPLTVCFVVIGKHVPRFRFLATLLSDEVLVPPSVRAYQRLLSNDQHKIDTFFKEETSIKKTSELLDVNLIPLIRLIESQRHKPQQNTEEVYRQLEKSLEAAGLVNTKPEAPESADENPAATPEENSSPTPASGATDLSEIAISSDASSAPPKPLLVIVPAAHRGEILAGEVINKAVSNHFRCNVIESDDLIDREVEEIVLLNPAVVLICVIGSQSLEQARFWTTRLREIGYREPLIVGCFGKSRRFDRLFHSFHKRGANWVVASARQLLNKLSYLKRKLESSVSR
jgi:predicted PurR-regulated permease PerM